MMRSVPVLLGLLACGSPQPEGADPAWCSDGVDNDRDQAFDCDDSDCEGVGECALLKPTTEPTTISTTPNSSGPVGAPGCPWAGTWTAYGAFCDGLDVTGDWKQTFSKVEMVVADQCTAEVVFEGESCIERESFGWTQTNGGANSTSFGIVNCQPNGCRFTTDDPGCMEGDRAAPVLTIPIETIGVQTLVTNGFLRDAWVGCAGDLRIRWQWVP